jgi:hypothetical protein
MPRGLVLCLRRRVRGVPSQGIMRAIARGRGSLPEGPRRLQAAWSCRPCGRIEPCRRRASGAGRPRTRRLKQKSCFTFSAVSVGGRGRMAGYLFRSLCRGAAYCVIDFKRAARTFTERIFPEKRALRLAAMAGTTGLAATFFPWLIGVPEDPLVLFRLAAGCVSGVGLGFYFGARCFRGPPVNPSKPPQRPGTEPSMSL